MNIEDCFHTEKFNSSEIAQKLYYEKPGVVLIQDFLQKNAQELLLNEIQANRTNLVKAKENYGKAEQRFFMYYFGFAETSFNQSLDFLLVSEFSRAYDKLSRRLVDIAGLSQKRLSSTGIHIYWKDGKYGLSPHRDESPAQLISVFVLDGYSPFYVADDHELKINKITFEAKPGSLLLMRGPRNFNERERTKKGPNYNPDVDPRPIHCVGPVEKDRTVILLRHIDESMKEKKC